MLHFILSRRSKNNTAEGDDEITENIVLHEKTGVSVDGSGSSKRKQNQPEDDDDSIQKSPSAKIARFELENHSSNSDWDLPQQMVDYVHRYMNIKIQDKEVKEKILTFNPVPRNIKKVPELDSYMKELLVENNKTQTLHIEKLLKSIQERDRNVLGPLSKIWSMTESERDAVDKEDEEAASSFILFQRNNRTF